MKKPPPPVPARDRLRREIEQAVAAGHALDDMTLKLSLNDVAHLKRDRTLPVADITFTGGVMRYLGVKVDQGGVTESTLDRGASADA